MISLSKIFRLSTNEIKNKNIQLKPISIETEIIEEVEEVAVDPNVLIKQAEQKLADANEQAKQLIENAEKQIEEKKLELEKQSEQIFEMAKVQGKEEGYQIGLAEAEKKYEEKFDEINQLIELTKLDYRNKLRKAEKDILAIALKSTEKILKKKLEDEPSLFLNLIKQVLHEVIEQPEINIYVHPKMFAIVKEQQGDLENLLADKTELYIYPKSDLHEHGCQIESPFGIIDVSLDVQLDLLKKELLKLVKDDHNAVGQNISSN